MRARLTWLLAASGGALVAVCAILGATPDLTHRIEWFLFLIALAFVVWTFALWVLQRWGASPAGPAPRRAPGDRFESRDRSGVAGTGVAGTGVARTDVARTGKTRAAVWVVFAVAVVARGVMLPARPVMSTDIYRYAWEGRMIRHGVNPFVTAPDDSLLAPFRNGDWSEINHPDLVTIYPPLAQAVFALGAWIDPGPAAQKALFSAFDMGVMALLFVALRRRGRSGLESIAYGWNPLVLFETAHSGHLDSIGAFFLLAAVLALERGRGARSGLALAGAVASKYLGVVLAPWVVLRGRKTLGTFRASRVLAVCAAAVLVMYLPFAEAGGNLVSSLRAYGEMWRFNGVPYELISRVWHDPLWVRRALAIVAGLCVGVLALRERSVVRFARRAVGAVLLLTPTLYPWYLIQIVPLLVLDRARAWLLWTGTVFFSYAVWNTLHATGRWELSGAVMVAEYAPFYALLAYEAWRSRSRRRDGAVDGARGGVA